MSNNSNNPQHTLVSSSDIITNNGFGPQDWGDGVTVTAYGFSGEPSMLIYDTKFIDYGFGVESPNDRWGQIDYYDNRGGESIEIDFGGPVSNVILRVGQMSTSERGRDETGKWTGYNSNGKKVAEGRLDPDDSMLGPNVTSSGSGYGDYPFALSSSEPFTKIVVEATGFDNGESSGFTRRGGDEDNSDFNVVSIAYDRGLSNVNNTPPTAVNDRFTTDEDSRLRGNILSNDTDADGNSLSANQLIDPSNGILNLSANGNFTYTPDSNFNGSDSFTYEVSDGQGGLDQATVNITVDPVNDAPTAVGDAANTQLDTAVTFDVLANDSDIDGNSLLLSSFGAASNGSLVEQSNGSLTYTPNAGFTGSDSFSYTIADSEGATATATVDIDVTLSNNPPTAINDTVTTNEDTTVTIDVTDNDTDTDGNLDPASAIVATEPNNGTVVNNGDGSFSYTPDSSFNGSDSFTYLVSDTQGSSDRARVRITVDPVNNAPTAVNDSFSTDSDTPLTFNVLSNDSDLEGDSLTVSNFTATAHGSIAGDQDGNMTYTPEAGFIGTDRFSYTLNDGNGGIDQATVSISVSNTDSSEPVTDGLQALYTFDEGSGNVVRDVSGVGTPIDLTIQDPNHVTWSDGKLTIDDPTLIVSDSPATKLVDSLTGTNEITVEAWLSADNLTQGGPARIVSLSENIKKRNFTLGQEDDAFNMRLRTTEGSVNGTRGAISSPADSLTADELTHVVYTRDANGTSNLYVDDELVKTRTLLGDFSNWDNSYQLSLANELTGDRPWLGTLDLVAIYDQAFDSSEVSQNFLAGPNDTALI